MYWIGVGFLIAIGFGLAIVAIPIIYALLVLAWECRAVVALALVILIAIGLAIAYPDAIVPIIFWGGIILWLFTGKPRKQKAIMEKEDE